MHYHETCLSWQSLLVGDKLHKVLELVTPEDHPLFAEASAGNGGLKAFLGVAFLLGSGNEAVRRSFYGVVARTPLAHGCWSSMHLPFTVVTLAEPSVLSLP